MGGLPNDLSIGLNSPLEARRADYPHQDQRAEGTEMKSPTALPQRSIDFPLHPVMIPSINANLWI
ncbi:MAG: hypothetical protein RL571_1621 [Pseudomonadota bacterium]|jgi:hypothetical protein